MKKITTILLLLGAFLLVGFKISLVLDAEGTFELITPIKPYNAGTKIQLTFSSTLKEANPQLFVIHSYGKTVLESKKEKERHVFEIPGIYAKKTGVISWFLIDKNEVHKSGKFEIIPNEQTESFLENYLGPRSIRAGNEEYTMLVVVPTDSFDNPQRDSTKVITKYQFLQDEQVEELTTTNFIAWHNIHSPLESGKLLVSTECNNTISKEIETEIYPNIASNFTIDYHRNHEYADGNQITSIKTSVIKDEYENIISDGTLVVFTVTTKNNMLLKTFGTTIRGIARSEVLHPDKEDIYKVKGFIAGIAESSNLLKIQYKPIIDDFDYSFSDEYRKIKIGPIKSFMGQLIPNGIKVVVKIIHQGKLIATLQQDAYNGFTTFNLPADFYMAKSYQFEITTLGITKETETIYYDYDK